MEGDFFSSLQQGLAPATLSEFECYGVNVVGLGINSSNAGNNPENPAVVVPKLLAGQSCTYPGVTSAPIQPNEEVNLTLAVPVGAQRIIQVAGIDDPDGALCSTTGPLGQATVNSGGSGSSVQRGIYELGRAVLDVFGPTSVSIDNTYATLTVSQRESRRMDCGSNQQCGGGSGGFDPLAGPSGLVFWLHAGQFTGSVPSNTEITANWSNLVTAHALSLVPINTGGGYPVYHGSAGPGGRPAVVFNGSNEFHISGNSVFSSLGAGVTVFVVGRRVSGNGDFFGASISSTFTPSDDYFKIGMYGGFESFVVSDVAESAVQYPASALLTNNPDKYYVLNGTWDPAAATTEKLRLAIFGLDTPQTALSTASAVVPTGYVFVGSAQNRLTGYVSEILAYNRALSAAERLTVKQYLSSKYCLP